MISEKDIANLRDMLNFCGATLKKTRKDYQNSYKIVGTQVKSIADQKIHKYLITHIKKIRKHAFVFSEESTQKISAQRIGNLDECFIIDPIDGTASFINGYPGYVIQIACLIRGNPYFSMVYAPEFDDMYMAIKGEGAYLNNKIIKVKNHLQSVVYIDNYPKPNSKINKMMKKQSKSIYLECGSIGLKICKIAEGQADIFYKDVILRDWDLLPPSIILQEAGGYIFSLSKEQIIYFSNDDYSHQGAIAISNLKLLNKFDCLGDAALV